jgi:hypothetical protein
MEKIELSAIEKEMANFNFDELNAHKDRAKAAIAKAASAADVKSEICQVWQKIRKFVVLAENVPVVGKYIRILVELLDTLCGAPQ